MAGKGITAAIAGGLTGAALIDLYLVVTEPLVVKGVTPRLVTQWDASNFIGAAAYHGGWATAALGTFAHFCVSLIWGAVFVAAALRLRWMISHPIWSGVVLGVVAMGVMRAVIHLGHAVVRPFPSVWLFIYILVAHVGFFGIPAALAATRLLSTKRSQARGDAGGSSPAPRPG
jgi:hypothetical protein